MALYFYDEDIFVITFTKIIISIFVASCRLVFKGLREKLGLDQCHITVRIFIDIITINSLKRIYIVNNLYRALSLTFLFNLMFE